jgi:hypothetical protein
MTMQIDFLLDELRDPRVQAVLKRCSPWLEATGFELYSAELPEDEWELWILSRAMAAEILRRFAFGESAAPAMSPSAHPMHPFWLHNRPVREDFGGEIEGGMVVGNEDLAMYMDLE